jgi:hypothetical protein
MENPATGNGRRTYLTNTILKDAGWLLENGFKVPAQPQRFTAVERSSGDIIWAYEADTLQSLAKNIEESETAGVDQVDVYDLDRPGVQFILERKIVAFFRSDERVEIPNPHQPPAPQASPDNPWEEHPDYPMSDWRYEVANEDTVRGYQDWVRAKLDE